MTENIVIQNEEIISVGELNKSAKYILENAFNNVSVIGEISNLSRPASGHMYFTLKDEDGAIRCAMFKNQNIKLNFSPENGDQCVLKGQVSIYAPRGDYQLIVKSIEPAGSGNLMQKFEALRKKLDDEGLFDKNKKMVMPSSPKHIAIITSPSTAAFQDIISTVQRRAPSAQISLSEASVQGENAHVSIIKALNRVINFNELNSNNKVDVVILSRGGGSIEDLWCFNNEELAREIFSFPIPTISGVGHEIDFTICDFVSDIRVPTPTASAELVSEFIYQLSDKLNNNNNKLHKSIEYIFEDIRQSINLNKSKLKNPLTLLREKSQTLDNIDLRLRQNHNNLMLKRLNKLKNMAAMVNNKSPLSRLTILQEKVNNVYKSVNRVIEEKLKSKRNTLERFSKNIQILNPLSILDRGYAIIINNKGLALKSSSETDKGEKLKARLSKGSIDIEVKNVKN